MLMLSIYFPRTINLCVFLSLSLSLSLSPSLSLTLPLWFAGSGGGVDNEGYGHDVVDAVLDSWVAVLIPLSDSDPQAATVPWPDFAENVLSGYLQARITKAKTDAFDESEIAEELETDRLLYEHQLTGVACVARLVAARSCALLNQVASDHATQLMQIIASGGNMEKLLTLSEEFHWILIVTGFVMTDSDKDDERIIPASIMACSVTAFEAGAGNDAVAALSVTLMQTLTSMTSTVGTPQHVQVSSTVVADLLWWAARWSKAYLMLDESKYEDQLSMSLLQSFGRDSDGARSIMSDFFMATCQTFIGWSGDPDVTDAAKSLLVSLTDGRVKRGMALTCASLQLLADEFRKTDSPLVQLPGEVQMHVTKALCNVASSAAQDSCAQLFSHIMQPQHEQFQVQAHRIINGIFSAVPPLHSLFFLSCYYYYLRACCFERERVRGKKKQRRVPWPVFLLLISRVLVVVFRVCSVAAHSMQQLHKTTTLFLW